MEFDNLESWLSGWNTRHQTTSKTKSLIHCSSQTLHPVSWLLGKIIWMNWGKVLGVGEACKDVHQLIPSLKSIPPFCYGGGYKQRTFDSSRFSAERTLTSESFAHLYRSTHVVTWGEGGGKKVWYAHREKLWYVFMASANNAKFFLVLYQTQNAQYQSGPQIQFQIYYGPFFGPKEYPLFAAKEN